MKFTPRVLPPEAADASRGHDRHPLRELALLVAGVGAICAALYLGAVLIADQVVTRISPATEARVFASFSTNLPQVTELSPGLLEHKTMAGRLLTNLLVKADLPGLPVKLIVWDKVETNAVALPGGTIALTTGLLRCLDDEPGMAFVLAHELGHFHARDHLRGLGRQISFQVVSALVLSGSGDLQIGAGQVGQLAFLSHSRKREAAADRYALKLVHDTYGSEAGAARLFEMLRKDGLPGWVYMFNTHPATEERIKELQRYAEELGKQPQH
jgi:Zn-dependent protease with chaperone function